MTTNDQFLSILLNAVHITNVPVKANIDGSEFLLIYNPATKQLESVKANIANNTTDWSEYTGNFDDNTGILKVGKLDENLTLIIDSTTNKIELTGLTEIQEAEILQNLNVNGNFATEDNIRINSINGSITAEYTENGDFVQNFQAKDGTIALLSDLQNIDLDGYVPYTGANQNLDLGANVVVTSKAVLNEIEFTEGQKTVITPQNTGQLTNIVLPSESGTLLIGSDIDNLADLDADNLFTGNNLFTGTNNVITRLNSDFINVDSISSRTSGEGAVNLNTLQAIGNSPSIKITDTVDKKVTIKVNDTNGDVTIKTPDKDGTILVDSDLNNTVTFNNQNAIVINNPDAEEVNGSLTKGEILFTDSSTGTVFKDFSIKKEDYQDSFLEKGSRLIISSDSNNYITLTNNNTIISGTLQADTISSNQKLRVANENGEIELFDTTSNRTLKINSNLITDNRDLQAPDVDGVIATKETAKDWTGWAQYGDSQYTSASPLVIPQGSTATIDLDGLGNTVKTQLPVGVTDFFDVPTSKIIPVKDGDGYSLSLSFIASNTSNNGDFTFFIDIGGGFTRIFPQVKRVPRGTGVDHEFVISFNYYTLNTFKANGGLMKIESGTGETSAHSFNLQIHKTHDAR